MSRHDNPIDNPRSEVDVRAEYQRQLARLYGAGLVFVLALGALVGALVATFVAWFWVRVVVVWFLLVLVIVSTIARGSAQGRLEELIHELATLTVRR